jgi:hypothetical protein
MKQGATFTRGWRRGDSVDPAQIMDALNGRVLNDTETCRAVWEHSQNPLAVCEALRRSDLPEWLRSAAVFLIVDGSEGGRRFAKKAWRGHHLDSLDKIRAGHVAKLRAYPGAAVTMEQACLEADMLTRARYKEAMPSVTTRGIQAAFTRVCTRLRDPWRYFSAPPGLHLCINAAYDDFLRLMKANVRK